MLALCRQSLSLMDKCDVSHEICFGNLGKKL